jgi:hypothetical protein
MFPLYSPSGIHLAPIYLRLVAPMTDPNALALLPLQVGQLTASQLPPCCLWGAAPPAVPVHVSASPGRGRALHQLHVELHVWLQLS